MSAENPSHDPNEQLRREEFAQLDTELFYSQGALIQDAQENGVSEDDLPVIFVEAMRYGRVPLALTNVRFRGTGVSLLLLDGNIPAEAFRYYPRLRAIKPAPEYFSHGFVRGFPPFSVGYGTTWTSPDQSWGLESTPLFGQASGATPTADELAKVAAHFPPTVQQ